MGCTYEAIDFYQKSYDLWKKLCDESGEINSFNSKCLTDIACEMAHIYIKQNKLKEALTYYHKADTDSEIDSEAIVGAPIQLAREEDIEKIIKFYP